MPELPEMETYKKLLTEKVGNRQISAAEVLREKTVNLSASVFTNQVEGRRITKISRRAKHLLFELNTGEVLLLHLMLGGWLYYGTEGDRPNHKPQVIFSFGDDRLYFLGLRLGYLHMVNQADLQKKLNELGPEPLEPDFSEEQFCKRISDKRGLLKTTLVDQHFIAGIGNCYSDEICFDAGILPLRKCPQVNEQEQSQLYKSIRSVLLRAVQFGGYMEQPFFKGDSLTGGFDDKCAVYDRENQPCVRCGGLIRKEIISGRKVFYCTMCQH